MPVQCVADLIVYIFDQCSQAAQAAGKLFSGQATLAGHPFPKPALATTGLQIFEKGWMSWIWCIVRA